MTFLILTSLLKILGIVFLIILPMVSYTVYAERRVSALIQDRLGPNRVGPAGLFQPIADALKFILKEDFTPGDREHLLLLARALSRDGAGDHDDRGRPIRQHACSACRW